MLDKIDSHADDVHQFHDLTLIDTSMIIPEALMKECDCAGDVAAVFSDASGRFSNALVAEALSRAGRKVLVLDRRRAVRGSTPASTAMIQHEIDVPLSRLIRQTGRARAEGVHPKVKNRAARWSLQSALSPRRPIRPRRQRRSEKRPSKPSQKSTK